MKTSGQENNTILELRGWVNSGIFRKEDLKKKRERDDTRCAKNNMDYIGDR